MSITLPAAWRDTARPFLKEVEGTKLRAYLDVCGVPTIGTGLTRINGKPVKLGMTITMAQNDAALDEELDKTGKLLSAIVKVPLSAHEAAALASFAFNEGGAALAGSTLLKRLNAGDRPGALAQFLVWDKGHVNGVLVPVAGLHNRRVKEQELFLLKDAA